MKARMLALTAALLMTALSLAGAAGKEVELDVRYSHPSPMYQGKGHDLTLYIRNLDASRPMNITWAGVHVDWLDPTIYHVNETLVRVPAGMEVKMVIRVDVPRSARVGNHTQNFNIEYDAYEGPGQPWGHYNWRSVPISDFKVASSGAPPAPSPSFMERLDDFMASDACIFVFIALMFLVIVTSAAVQAARRRARSGGTSRAEREAEERLRRERERLEEERLALEKEMLEKEKLELERQQVEDERLKLEEERLRMERELAERAGPPPPPPLPPPGPWDGVRCPQCGAPTPEPFCMNCGWLKT